MRENSRADTLSLDGEWQITVGAQAGPVCVPGAWEVQGYDHVPDHAVYRREFTVPETWPGAQVWLQFGAVSYSVEVFLNDVAIGTHEGLWTAFELDLTAAIRFGVSNTLELRITKPGLEGQTFPYREVLGGFLPYTAMAFGGPWQPVRLLALREPAIIVDSVKALWPDGRIEIAARVDGPGVDADGMRQRIEVLTASGAVVASLVRDQSPEPLTLTVPDPQVWSPLAPALYTVRLRIVRGGQVIAETARHVGFRALAADGERLLLNAELFCARGLLSWGWNPETLAPTFTDEAIREEFRRARTLGFNLIKLCLFVPPARYFELADEEGMLLWLELPLWWQRTTPHLRQQVGIEYADILRAVHAHPSIVLYSLGCELEADMADGAMLSELNTLARAGTVGALVCDNSGSGEAYAGLSVDYADFADYHFYCDLHYFTPLLDHFRRDWRRPRPWIFGEYADSDTYRDPDELDAGGRPWWRNLYGIEGNPNRWAYPEQAVRMAALELPFSGPELKAISYRQSFAIRKFMLERTRSRRDVGGYVLTMLRDTPIATSGVYDDFGLAKFDTEAFRQFNADAVLLLDRGRARRWTHGGDRPAPMDLYNHLGGTTVALRLILARVGAAAARSLEWRLRDPSGLLVDQGQALIPMLPPLGVPGEIAALDLTLPFVDAPGEWALEARLDGVASNHWPLWVYPAVDVTPPGVAAYDPAGQLGGRWPAWSPGGEPPLLLLATWWDQLVEAFVRGGGNAIVLQPEGGGLPSRPVPFWREAIHLFYPHPVLEQFPHRGHADLQFYHLATDHAFDTAALADYAPVPMLRRLDARLFTLTDTLIELRPGAGRVLASSLRFFGGAGDQVRRIEDSPAALWLLRNMMAYLLET